MNRKTDDVWNTGSQNIGAVIEDAGASRCFWNFFTAEGLPHGRWSTMNKKISKTLQMPLSIQSNKSWSQPWPVWLLYLSSGIWSARLKF